MNTLWYCAHVRIFFFWIFFLVLTYAFRTMIDTKLRFKFESLLERCKEVHELVDWGEKEEPDDDGDMEIGLTLPLDGMLHRRFSNFLF